MNYINQPFAFDRDLPFAKKAFRAAAKTERAYAQKLRKVAQHIKDMIGGLPYEDFQDVDHIQLMLRRYAEMLEPWAKASADRMLKEVEARDIKTWRTVAADIGKSLKQEIHTAPTGHAMQRLLAEQVTLIKSLPLEAAQRVSQVAQQGLLEGQRPVTLAREILKTGDVTKSRANLIARTETARAASVLSQVRAQSIGCTHFIWRTLGDSDVRPSHRKLNGQAFRYDDPPLCDPPDVRALPGQVFNCRCVAHPIIPEI